MARNTAPTSCVPGPTALLCLVEQMRMVRADVFSRTRVRMYKYTFLFQSLRKGGERYSVGIWRTMASAGRAVEESGKEGGMEGREARGADRGWEGWALSPSSLPDSIQSMPPLLAYLCAHTHIARWREKQMRRGKFPTQIPLALAHLSAVMLPLCPSIVLVCPSAGPPGPMKIVFF